MEHCWCTRGEFERRVRCISVKSNWSRLKIHFWGLDTQELCFSTDVAIILITYCITENLTVILKSECFNSCLWGVRFQRKSTWSCSWL
uniref:Uncharacterized protein n=1 Tax=Anguilla anguilla TaxID=7936 RepID=A0A0E9XHP4_ANGAN